MNRDLATAQCPDEDDFTAMYAALGNRESQRAIRDLNPDRRHCEILMVDPRGCQYCPKNPNHNKEPLSIDQRALMEDHAPDIARGIETAELVHAGVTFPADQTPWRFARRLAVVRALLEAPARTEGQRSSPPSVRPTYRHRHPGPGGRRG